MFRSCVECFGVWGFVNTVQASGNTWGEVRGSRTHPGVQFPSDLLRNAKFGFRAETSRKSRALLVCYRLVRKRGKSVTRESDASFGERMGYAHLAFFDQNRLELWNTPILNCFHRVGRGGSLSGGDVQKSQCCTKMLRSLLNHTVE